MRGSLTIGWQMSQALAILNRALFTFAPFKPSLFKPALFKSPLFVKPSLFKNSAIQTRAFKRECVDNLKFFKGMHRFLPTLFKIEGYTVGEVAIGHNPRTAGVSHYGVWNRLFASSYDLLAVRWMKKRMFRYKVAERVN